MTPYALDIMLDAYTGMALYVSLHDADPTTVGDNEVAGTTRQALTWNLDTDSSRYTDDVTFTAVPSGTLLTHVGIWDAVTGGNFIDAREQAEDLSAGGDYTFNLILNQYGTLP